MPNQELTVTSLQRVTYRDLRQVLDGDSIAESGNNASDLFDPGPEVVSRQWEAGMGIAPIPDRNRGSDLG